MFAYFGKALVGRSIDTPDADVGTAGGTYRAASSSVVDAGTRDLGAIGDPSV